MNKNHYKRCKRCVMDSTDPSIVFDDSGICDHCLNFLNNTKPNWPSGTKAKKKLEILSEKIKSKGKGKDFDCIIGMSGGIDSSYLVYVAKEVMHLRPLVFHVDAGWNSDLAVNNIEKIVDGLGIDLFTEVIDWHEMKDLQLSFLKSGVPHIDAPQDHAFFATMYKFASKYDVKYILTGANLSTECIRNPIEWMYFQSDSEQLKDIHRKFGSIPLKKYPLTSILWHKLWLPYFKKIKLVKPLDLIPYIKKEAAEFLSSKFDWRPYKQKHFESRFTKFYESYWLFERFGYDVRKVQFSSLILTGQMTRDQAIKELVNKPYDANEINNDIEFVANKLEISIDTLNEYMCLPKKTYRDYDNQKYLYSLGSKVLSKLGLEIGYKR